MGHDLRLVERDPHAADIAQGLGYYLGVVGEALRGVAISPATGIL